MTEFGPTGQLVYERTYSRTKPDGTKETWPETVRRVVDGNLSLVSERYQLPNEREHLIRMMEKFQIIPAGRHLWASGVRGRQYLFNCHVSGWGESPWDHFEFTFLRLMEGGGVGANYSNRYLDGYPDVVSPHNVHIVCDSEHPDYEAMDDADLLSNDYLADWEGCFEIEDSREGWASALVDLISTYYRPAKHRNRVFDVSRVRPAGSRLKAFGGHASGPKPLAEMLHEVAYILNSVQRRDYGMRLSGMEAMEIDHAIAKCVVSGGNRRSARMAIMHWNDPQIGEFLWCKSQTGQHWTTNISVEVDDDFWALDTRHSNDLLDMIASGMLHNGEPGIWNSSYANEGEPNEVVATNPCAEVCLEPWENCNLGHVNLAAFAEYDDTGIGAAHRLMTRFLIRATYGDVNDPKQAEVLARNRRIGVGHLGVASYLALRGIRYSDAPDHYGFKLLLANTSQAVDDEARRFTHQLRIPVPVKTRTVAPTGTIAKMPGVSEGIHPIFAKYFIRRIRFSVFDPDQMGTVNRYVHQGYTVEDCRYAPDTVVIEIPTKDSLLEQVATRYGEVEAERIVQSAADLSLGEMLRFQQMYQGLWADNAVSYTANVDADEYTVSEVAELLEQYGLHLKGATVFPETSMPQAPYERITREEYETSEFRDVADSVDENCVSGACPVR